MRGVIGEWLWGKTVQNLIDRLLYFLLLALGSRQYDRNASSKCYVKVS